MNIQLEHLWVLSWVLFKDESEIGGSKLERKTLKWEGGGVEQWIAIMLLDPAGPGSIPGISKMFSSNFILVQLRLIDTAAKKVANYFIQAHLLLACGKQVLK